MMKRIQLEYLFEDRPVQENTAPADYDALDIVSGGSHIYGQIMWPDGGVSRAPALRCSAARLPGNSPE